MIRVGLGGKLEIENNHCSHFDGMLREQEHVLLLDIIVASWWWDWEASGGQHQRLQLDATYREEEYFWHSDFMVASQWR